MFNWFRRLLNNIYFVIGAVITIVATLVGMVNKFIFPSPEVASSLQYLNPISKEGSTDITASDAVYNLKNTRLGNRKSIAQAQTVSTNFNNTQWDSYDRPEDFPKTFAEKMQVINLKDGTQLAAYVTLPADENGNPIKDIKFPVILLQTPYNNSLGIIGGLADPYIVKRGYAYVVVDVRGTGNSSGEWEAFGKQEQKDADEIVNWVTQQDFSNGKIGLYGASYFGIIAMLTAANDNPAVKALFTVVPMGDAYRDILYNGGQGNQVFVPLWFGFISAASLFPIEYYSDPAKAFSYFTNKIDNIHKFQKPTFFNAYSGASNQQFDGEFWAERSPLEQADKIKVPTFIIGGIKDLFQRSEPLWQEALKDHTIVKILIGPWNHGSVSSTFTVGEESNIPQSNRLVLRWFDFYIKDMKQANADTLPNVTQWVEGEDRFVTTTDWPHPAIEPDRLFLRKDSSFYFTGALEKAIPTAQASENFFFKTPFSGFCSNSIEQATAGVLSGLGLPCMQNSNFANMNSVVFETEPLKEDYYFNGPIQADLWVSSDTSELPLAVRVSDVDPDTYDAKTLTTGVMTASLRKVDPSRSRYIKGQMIQPWNTFKESDVKWLNKNEPILVQFEIPPTAAKIKAGHKLQISIAAGDIWKGVAPPFSSRLQAEFGSASLYVNAKYPSSVLMPKVDTKYLARP